ncbi:hypothetical protein GGI02_005363 [Coemansia sp. RSA 2322]|nr:hypothetical protein GGI02_005363 [Coemansia sp. RSA 2322]
MYYSEEKVWRKVSFPPGVTAGQARDICMLRFNVWHRVMERDMELCSTGDGGNSAGGGSGMANASMCIGGNAGSVRELYGLYWPGGGQWLDSLTLMSKYALRSGDILELQDVGAFIPTPVEVTKSIMEVEHSRTVQSMTVTSKPSLADSLGASGMAESQVHYLFTKDLSSSWRLCWLELQDHVLVCSKKRGCRTAPLVRIHLARGFKLVDGEGRRQAGAGAGAGDRRVVGADRESSDSSSASSSMASILGLAARQPLGGDGAPLIIKCDGQVHVFCTLSAVDYDCWRRALQSEQGCGASAGGGGSSVDRGWAAPPSIAAPGVPQPWSAASSASSIADRPRRDRFAAVATVRLAGLRLVGLRAAEPRPCVVAAGCVYVLGAEAAVARAGELGGGALAAAAEACVALGSGACVERDGAVIRVVRADRELLWLDAGSAELADQWASALAEIGGLSAPDHPAVRRSRSFVSAVARVDWPMPPMFVHRSPQRANMPQHPPPPPPAAAAAAASPDAPLPAQRNAIRDLRPQHLLPSRFPWFRRYASSSTSPAATLPKRGL